MRNSEAGAVQSTRPSFGRHRKSEGRIARRSRQGENLAMPLGKTKNREIGKNKKGRKRPIKRADPKTNPLTNQHRNPKNPNSKSFPS